MIEHGIDSDAFWRSGVIGFEVLLSATRAFFHGAEVKVIWERVGERPLQSLKVALAIWGKSRIRSAVMHLDEHTLHLHLFVLPPFRRLNQR